MTVRDPSKYRVLSPDQYSVFRHDFDSMDKDGSGSLDRCEILRLLKSQLNRHASTRELSLAMHKFDLNQDGRITLPE